jgi:phenylacetate-CoA ligase
MSIFESVRKIFFWSNDFIRGNVINKCLSEMKLYYANRENDARDSHDRIRSLLSLATRTVPFYYSYPDRHLLSEFPIITKQLMKERYDDFFSNIYKKSELLVGSTSGSYGTPFTFYLTKENKARQTAELVYFNSQVGFDVGMKHAHFASRKKSRFEQFKRNQIVVNPERMDSKWCEQGWHKLRNSGVKAIVGYPSALLFFGEYLSGIKERKNFNPIVVISIAEPLSR